MIPKNFKCLDLACGRVCICTRDYIMEQRVNALNKKIKFVEHDEVLPKSSQELSDISLCKYSEYPARECIDRTCNLCGTQNIKDYRMPLFTAFTDSNTNDLLKFHQWETRKETYTNRDGHSKKTTRWMQVEKKTTTQDVITDIAEAMESYTGHIFRANFQNKVQASLIKSLPLDHCLVVMDYSENMTLQPQDEIESAHFPQKQVTVFPIYIVRHASESTEENPVIQKEFLVILSDHLVHNASAVFVFTNQLLIHLRNSPGPSVKVIHRFSDNCATQFEYKDAFSHLFSSSRKV
ncbi:unnamed protein product [Mytilus edulis]|uniref:Uncharacterized protein n=1 Tax=Mytilus edulis TaxID=6550 RepID=A0A8S3SJ66_MYTED|nr:unnamed protein product [Mytilus edulis]